ncbi:MAG: hypothetical protein WCX28_04690 [Bacteriovoracaceae bacterium]|nr:hypothetical protein [Bacteroidota bacterium]
MKKNVYIIIALLSIIFSVGCDEERVVTANTHDERVPEVTALSASIDSSISTPSKFILRLLWGYDTLRYPIAPNIKNWEVYRVVASDTLTYKFQLQKFVQIPFYADSSISIQPAGRDSVVVLYRIIPIGNVVENIQFTGKPSDILRVVIHKK